MVEGWTIVDNDERDDHAFHIHTNPFQVTPVNRQPQADLQWRNSITIPNKGGGGRRSRFLDYTGIFMLHCHMMNHEEMSMMQTVEVQGLTLSGSLAMSKGRHRLCPSLPLDCSQCS